MHTSVGTIAGLGGDCAGPWYRVLAVTAPWRPSSAEQDFIAILPAVLTAARRGRPFVIGWLSRGGGAPLELITNAGPVAAGQGDERAGQPVELLFPAGARGVPVAEHWLPALDRMVWAPCPGRQAPPLAPADARDPQPGGPAATLFESTLVTLMRRPFGWLVVAEPTDSIDAEVADLHTQLDVLRPRDEEQSRFDVERAQRRLAELDRFREAGRWNVRVLAGAATEDELGLLAPVLVGSVDLGRHPYRLRSTGRPQCLADALMAEVQDARDGAYVPFAATAGVLSALAGLPRREVPGLRVLDVGYFDVTSETERLDSPIIELGAILDGQDRPVGAFRVPLATLNRHAFVTGATGSGKSQTVRHMLEQLTRAGLPWLAIEPVKSEYAAMAGRIAGLGQAGQVTVINPSDPDAVPLSVNPLAPEPGYPVQAHIDMVRALFMAAFDAEEPFPQIMSQALQRVYEASGWDVVTGGGVPGALTPPAVPTLAQLQRAALAVIEDVGYGRELQADVRGFVDVRLRSLRIGSAGRFFEGGHPADIGTLLRRNVVLAIEDVANDEDKAFLMGTLIIRIVEHLRLRARRGRRDGLQHVIVIEEAHRLLRAGREGRASAHAVELFAGLLAEVRAYGEGLIIAEQIPDRLIQDVIKNTAVKITHRLPAADDREAVGATMNMTQAQNRFLVTLKPGEAAVFADGMDFPLLAQMPDGTSRESAAAAVTASPAGVVRTRSVTCGADCAGRPCTLRDMRVAQRALDEYPAIRLWTELSVVAHLTGWPMPVPCTALLSLLQLMPSRLRDCAISHGVDAAVNVRVPVIAGRVSPVGLASHVSTAIRSRISRGSWLCQREEPKWLAPAYKWTLVLDALKSADRKSPGAGPHPRSSEWERTYGQVIAGDTCARQVGTVQRWYDGAQRDGWEVRAVAFGVDGVSGVERAVGARAEDDDFEERLAGYLDQFVDCRWPRLYLTADPLGDPPEPR